MSIHGITPHKPDLEKLNHIHQNERDVYGMRWWCKIYGGSDGRNDVNGDDGGIRFDKIKPDLRCFMF